MGEDSEDFVGYCRIFISVCFRGFCLRREKESFEKIRVNSVSIYIGLRIVLVLIV